MNSLLEVQSEEAFDEVLRTSSLPVLVSFAVECCKVCSDIRPRLEEIAEERRKEVLFVSVQAAECEDGPSRIIEKLDIKATPSFLFASEGHYLAAKWGVRGIDIKDFEFWLNKRLKKLASPKEWEQARHITEAAPETFASLVLNNPGNVVVSFTSDLSPACAAAEPAYELLAFEMSGKASFVNLGLDLPNETFRPFFDALKDRGVIRGVPTFMFFRNGRHISTEAGFRSEERLYTWLNQTLSSLRTVRGILKQAKGILFTRNHVKRVVLNYRKEQKASPAP